MHRYQQRVYIVRVWLEREPGSDAPRWRASLTDESDGRRLRYFSSDADLLEHLRGHLQRWPETGD